MHNELTAIDLQKMREELNYRRITLRPKLLEEVKTARAEGLRECRKLMTLARAGKYNGYLLEGMACPGGCVAGAGTLLPVDLASTVVGRYQKEADQTSPLNSPYRSAGRELD